VIFGVFSYFSGALPAPAPKRSVAMTIKINNAFIRKIARDNPPKVREFRDTNLRGFVVRQQPSGFIAYYAVVFRGSTRRGNRRQRKWRIGEHPAIGPSEARKLAEEIIGQARLDNLPIEKELERWQLGDFLDSHYRPWATQHLKARKDRKGSYAGLVTGGTCTSMNSIASWSRTGGASALRAVFLRTRPIVMSA